MTEQGKIIKRAEAIFNFLLKKQRHDRTVGDLKMQDFLEICLFLSDLEIKLEMKNGNY